MDVKYVIQDLNEITTKEYIISINNALERLYTLNRKTCGVKFIFFNFFPKQSSTDTQ
jgi:hypothetical protein